MDSNIKIETEGLAGSLESFQSQMSSMQTLLGEIKTATSGIKNQWEGNLSETVLSSIEQFQEVFQSIEEQNQKYVNFLNNVINLYTEADTSNNSALDSNAESYSVSG